MATRWKFQLPESTNCRNTFDRFANVNLDYLQIQTNFCINNSAMKSQYVHRSHLETFLNTKVILGTTAQIKNTNQNVCKIINHGNPRVICEHTVIMLHSPHLINYTIFEDHQMFVFYFRTYAPSVKWSFSNSVSRLLSNNLQSVLQNWKVRNFQNCF